MSLQELALVRYYDGQFLTVDLYNVEQSYFQNLSAYLNMGLLTSGTMVGLAVSQQGSTAVGIAAGLAVDALGRQLVWPANQGAVPLPAGLVGSVPVSIQFAQQSPSGNPNIYTQLPAIQFGPPADPNLMLATLTVEGGKITAVEGAPVAAQLKLQPLPPPASSTSPAPPTSLQPSTSQASSTSPRSAGESIGRTADSPLLAGRSFTGVLAVPLGSRETIVQGVTFGPGTAFAAPPLVLVTVYADPGVVVAATVSAVTAQGFTVALARIAPRAGEVGTIQLNWLAFTEP